ncbi:MAG TPA: hypothetical protein DCL21_02830 [Alphaproteobacteria bacterium]|nr:hypothetical protein [Alphaproteobacteria bacterium]
MYKNNDKDFEGVAFYQQFEGAAILNKRSADFIYKSLDQDSQKYLNKFSKEMFKNYYQRHLCLASTCNKISSEKKIAQLIFHLASKSDWNIGVYCFEDLNFDINETAVVKYCATHKIAHNHGIMTKMLWLAECFLAEHGKKHLLVSLDLSNFAAIKCFLNTGYVIRSLDQHDGKNYLVLYKHIDWSKGVNFYLGNDGHYQKMEDRNYIIGKINTYHITKQIGVNNINGLAKLLQEGYYPSDIINLNYVCHKINSLPIVKPVRLQGICDAA